jgi:hypothetical protein
MSEKTKNANISRRNFIKNGAAAGVGATALGVLTPQEAGAQRNWDRVADVVVIGALIGAGQPVKIRMRSESKTVPNLTSASIWGTLPGATDENIIIMAHQDVYSDAAIDNASGVAAMLALAATFVDMQQGAGEMGAVKLDAPSLQILRSPDDKHTDMDTLEWVPASGLEAVTRAYAKIIDETNRVDRKDLLSAAPLSTGGGAR